VERKAVVVSLGVVVVAAAAWFTFRPTGVRIGPLRVVPPAPGECIGRIEATVVNGTSETVQIGRLKVLQDGKNLDSILDIFPLEASGPVFATFATYLSGDDGPGVLEPGASRLLSAGIVRVRGGAAARVALHGEIYGGMTDEGAVTLKTLPVDVAPDAWPLPTTMSTEALDRALREGQELSIVLDWWGMPGGGRFALRIGPGGAARGRGDEGLEGRPNPEAAFRAAGTLTPEQQKRLRAAVRAAPLGSFHPDPKYLRWNDGRRVRLLVAAGPAALVACSLEEDFEAGGLAPLLEQLRVLLRDLPDAEVGR